jgi:acyl dehydratase
VSVSPAHLLSQAGPLVTLGRVALRALQRDRDDGAPAPQDVPGPWSERVVQGPREPLVRAFVANAGGDPGWYRGRVPPALFAQWTFDTLSRALDALPWNLTRVLNARVELEPRAAIPVGVPLVVRARLLSVERDERRARIVTEVHTGPRETPDALRARVHTHLPFGKAQEGSRPRARSTEVVRPSLAARELSHAPLGATAGRDFGLLTGDLNPIHWLAPAARFAGFRGAILHGFASMARAIESLNRAVFVGDPQAMTSLDVRFLRPLVLPARVGVYADRLARSLWIADGPDGPAYLSGQYSTER